MVRLNQIIAALQISASAWWAGVRDGRLPQPVRLGKRMTLWRTRDIRELLERGARY